MKRWLFNTLSILSVAVCLMAAASWLRSAWVADLFFTYSIGSDHCRIVACSGGRIGFVAVSYARPLPARALTPGWQTADPARDKIELYTDDPHWLLGGFAFLNKSTTAIPAYTAIVVPYWAICVLSAFLPVVWLRHRVRQARARRVGCCLHCGYDLRASKERCPECGTPIPATSPVGEVARKPI